jgi:hypothetical protein
LDNDRDEILASYIDPLRRRIRALWLYQASINGGGWQDFELPIDPDISRHFVQVLLNSYYAREWMG